MDDEKTTEGSLMEIIDEFIAHHVEKTPYIYNVCNINNKPNRSTARDRSLFFNERSSNFNDLYGYKMTGKLYTYHLPIVVVVFFSFFLNINIL